MSRVVEELRSGVALLEDRYRGHPAASASIWSSQALGTLHLDSFRGHGPFVWQDRHNYDAYHRSYSDLCERYDSLMHSAQEDGAFGARCEVVDGKAVSRDLLDSVAEIGLICSLLNTRDPTEVLDIGAGYGRLGHRIDELAPPTWRVRCVDGVPISSHVCAYYLGFRGTTRATALPLDQIEASLARTPATIACNIHSFPEMPCSAIEWWLRLLAEYDVSFLFLVPNEIGDLRSTELDGTRVDFKPLLSKFGFSLVYEGLKYRSTPSSAEECVVFQDAHLLFAR